MFPSSFRISIMYFGSNYHYPFHNVMTCSRWWNENENTVGWWLCSELFSEISICWSVSIIAWSRDLWQMKISPTLLVNFHANWGNRAWSRVTCDRRKSHMLYFSMSMLPGGIRHYIRGLYVLIEYNENPDSLQNISIIECDYCTLLSVAMLT